MDDRALPELAEEFAAALDWWREAGVDCTFDDQPRRWTAPPPTETGPDPAPATVERQRVRTAAPANEVEKGPDRSSWPQDLAGFASWWLTQPWLDYGRVADRIPPRGDGGAQLMIVVPEPEREDRERLLSGPDGRLLDAILLAMGLKEADIYLASALPRYTPAADWTELRARGMGDLLAHHIALVRPERLLFFGGSILSLTGNAPPQGSAVLQKFNHEGTSIPLLAARGLPGLRQRPAWKAELWRAWLDWTGQDRAESKG